MARQDVENQERSGLNRVASKSMGVTILGATLLVAGVAVVGLCIGLGVAYGNPKESTAAAPAAATARKFTHSELIASYGLEGNTGGMEKLLDRNDDGEVEPEELYYGANRVFCEAQHGKEKTNALFNCLDVDKDKHLSQDECFSFGEDVEKPVCTQNPDEKYGPAEECESQCESMAAPATGLITYCNYADTETLPNGTPCPVQASKRTPTCESWRPVVRGNEEDNILEVFRDQKENPLSSWSKANTACQGAYKNRVAVYRCASNKEGGCDGTEGGDGAPGSRRLQFIGKDGEGHQVGGWSHSGVSWKDDRILCNDIVKKAKVTAYGAAKSDAELEKSAADGGTPEVENTGTGGNNCQFFAFRVLKKKKAGDVTPQPTAYGDPPLSGQCDANPCQGLGDGRCTPEITGGRCVWYQKTDTWNPWGQTGCYTSPCNNPTPNRAYACKNRPWDLAGANQRQASCSTQNSVAPGEVRTNPKTGKTTAYVNTKTKTIGEGEDAVTVKVDPRCNRFTCEWCKYKFLGCQNAHPHGWYTARMNDLQANGGGQTSRSVGCRAMWNSDKGEWQICDKKAYQKNKNACTGWRRELCSGTPTASCNCNNPFCSVESLVKKSFYTDNGMTPPKNWIGLTEKYTEELLATKTQEGDEAERKITCSGLESIGRGLGGKFTSGSDFNWKGKSNYNLN